MSWREIDRIAVGVGPGTFTGLRVGVATARGLAQSLSAELVGVSSLRALAAGAFAADPVAAEGSEPTVVLAVIDARRGEVFAAAYESGADVPRELAAPRALVPERLAEVVAQAEDVGGERRSWLAVGDGAVRFRAATRVGRHRRAAGLFAATAGQCRGGVRSRRERPGREPARARARLSSAARCRASLGGCG